MFLFTLKSQLVVILGTRFGRNTWYVRRYAPQHARAYVHAIFGPFATREPTCYKYRAERVVPRALFVGQGI